MARADQAIEDNVEGDFFVDSSCIDCDLCRQLARGVFARTDRQAQSFVARQPANDVDRHRALLALVTCPTSSIGTRRKLETKAAARAFPIPIDGISGVLFCGYASADSYGASSYLIRRPEGNVLVDSPRAASTLIDRVAELGGVEIMVLTHRDDVADHRAWHERFGCTRVIHRADVDAGTRDCERIVDGDVELAPDLRVIAVPGHTRGSIALLHDEILFTGDHVWANDGEDGLEVGRDVCWYSWPEQRRSVAKLSSVPFRHVLPGHGRAFHAASTAAMHAEIVRLAGAM
ncbi:MAG: Metallo-beta-lactamase superfamily protein [Myxococcales bacterium]|nr:Metallo-beta-lactamase superfamily protein [Myxococcales bacterium]